MKKRKVQVVLFYCDTNHKKHILLLKVNEARGLFWQNVTGGVEKNEKYIQAAVREAQEETGLEENNIYQILRTGIRLRFMDQWKKSVTEKVFLIHCKNFWEVELDPNEHCEFKWINEDEINKDIVKYASNVVALERALEYQCSKK